MFFPGETVTHRFIVPFDKNEIDKIIVTYVQGGDVVLEKEITSSDIEDLDTSGQSVNHISAATTVLSETESLIFRDNAYIEIQLNVITGDTRHVSHLMRSSSGIQYKREVILNE